MSEQEKKASPRTVLIKKQQRMRNIQEQLKRRFGSKSSESPEATKSTPQIRGLNSDLQNVDILAVSSELKTAYRQRQTAQGASRVSKPLVASSTTKADSHFSHKNSTAVNSKTQSSAGGGGVKDFRG